MTLPPNPFQSAHVIARARQGLATVEPGKTYNKIRAVVRSVKTATVSQGQNAGKPYLILGLGDRTGDLEVKSWDGASLAEKLPIGTVVEFTRLEVDAYQGKRGGKFMPADLQVLTAGSYDATDFVASLLPEEIEHHWTKIQEFLDSIENPDLQRLRDAVFAEAEVAQKYKTHPSAVRHHHNYLGGNVEHVHGIMRVVSAVCQGYPVLDRDITLMGAALHDLGKLREYAVDTTIRVTEDGRLRGHLVIGAEWLGQICQRLRRENYDFPAGLEAHLVHMILSHHRRGDWGSPKPPATPEAALLHLADYADSQTKGILQFVDENRDNPEGWAKRWDNGDNQWVKTRPDWE